jgi:hypothetical protein
MNSALIGHIIRAVVIILLQGLVFQRIFLGGASFNFFALIVYPVILMLLPVNTSRLMLVIFGFIVGIGVDFFYSSLGVHASAAVFIAFLRPYIMQMLEPRGGYPVATTPNHRAFGLNWFVRYSALMLVLYLLFYFSVEVFTFVYAGQIILKAISSFVLSYLAILAYVILFNPK